MTTREILGWTVIALAWLAWGPFWVWYTGSAALGIVLAIGPTSAAIGAMIAPPVVRDSEGAAGE